MPAVSSSDARTALARGDYEAAARILHPDVLAWCRDHGPWQPGGGAAAATTQEPHGSDLQSALARYRAHGLQFPFACAR